MAQPTAQTGHSGSGQQPNGIIRSYDAHGWLLRSVSYRAGVLDGAELLFEPVGGTLCTLPLELARDLERRELSAELRWALAEHKIALPGAAVVTIVEPEREYLIEPIGQSYTVRVMDGYLAVAIGRLLRATLFQDGAIVSRTHYQAGRLEGERATYASPGEPLFALGLDFQPAFDSGNLKQLQPVFNQHGYSLPDDALIALDLAGSEWRIIQPDRMLSVLQTGDRLTIYPGRVVERALFADGQLIETAHYQSGWLDGVVTIYGPLGAALFSIDLALSAALDGAQRGVLTRLFQQHGHALSPDALVMPVLDGGEWFIAQAGQSYTIRRGVDHLSVYPGRIISRSSYRRGKLDGVTELYGEDGLLAQQVCYRDGLLDGPMTVYAAGVKQTLVTFQQGKKHGPMIAYDQQGRAAMISEYQQDQLDGEVSLYKAGKLQAVVSYRGGVQHGRSLAYHPSGRESLSAPYANGLLHGESVVYNETGQVVKTSQYRDGKLEGAVIEYYPSGTVRTHATYQDDKLEGIVYVYDDQGRLKEKTHYRNGEPVGKPEQRSWRQLLTQR
jgi:antitoxin component YwqK of YwqJK toxin-antitoxin module